jgi:hypothetical protein
LKKKQAMSKRVLFVGLFIYALAGRACADTLNAQLFPLSGEIRFRNTNGSAVPFVFYSISSAVSGSLNPSLPQWRSISDFYDASGNGFIDATHEWSKLLPVDPSKEVAEGVFSPPGTGGSLPALRSVTLGPVWNPNVVPWTALTFDVQQDTGPVTIVKQLAVEGDYDNNGTVNMSDYTVWRVNFGSTTLLDADGNINGVVDAADYAIWRKNFGNFLPGAGSGAGGSLLQVPAAIPEPATIALILLAVAMLSLAPARRRAA